MFAKLVTVLGALSGRRAMVIVPPFSSVITALLGALMNWIDFTTHGVRAGVAVARAAVLIGVTVRIGVADGAAAPPHAPAITAMAARVAAILTRW